MIEILKDGTIVISLGIAGILLLLYIMLEIASLKIRKISFLHSIVIYSIYLYRFNKTIPIGWTNKTKLHDFVSLRKTKKLYSVLQQLDSEIEEKRIYTFVYIDWLGRIVKNDFTEVCRTHEETMDPGKIKSFRREKILKDLDI
jgi:hypothetical protein